MGPVENPSAGKFGPPAGTDDRFEAPPPPRSTARRLTQIALALMVVRLLLDWYERRPGHHSAEIVAALLALTIVEWAVAFKRADASDHTPYRSTPHITR